jgi:hypothetical protein
MILTLSDIFWYFLVLRWYWKYNLDLYKADFTSSLYLQTDKAFVSGEIWTDITSAYEEELSLKTFIKENIAHAPDEDNRLFYVSAWVNQPYISNSVEIAVEALLKETGHRWNFYKTLENLKKYYSRK